jgi:hypothetical protein
MKLGITNKSGVKGSVQRVLVDKNGVRKAMFADNWLWKLIKKNFNLDIQIPFITGNWTINPIKDNLVTTVGKAAVADQLGGTTTAPMTCVAIGIGTDAAAAADTTLGSEITTNGGERGAATVSNQTTTTAGDTERWIKTFTFTGAFAVTEEGILDNNTAGGVLLARQVFSAVNVVSGDSLQITHNIQVTTT